MHAEESHASNSNLPPPVFSSTKFPLYPCFVNNNPPTILITEACFVNLCSPYYIPPRLPFPPKSSQSRTIPPSPYWIFFTSDLLQTIGASPLASFKQYVLHHLSCPPHTGSTKQSSWSTRHNLLHQLTRPACRICVINATLEAVLLKQRHGHTRPMPPATASTALDLLYQ
jgi:hypothetical protein